MTTPVVIRCAGRAVTADGQATGDPCGRTYPRGTAGPYLGGPGQPVDDHAYRQHARAAGWRLHITPEGTVIAACDRCSRPDPQTVAVCRDIEKGLRR